MACWRRLLLVYFCVFSTRSYLLPFPSGFIHPNFVWPDSTHNFSYSLFLYIYSFSWGTTTERKKNNFTATHTSFSHSLLIPRKLKKRGLNTRPRRGEKYDHKANSLTPANITRRAVLALPLATKVGDVLMPERCRESQLLPLFGRRMNGRWHCRSWSVPHAFPWPVFSLVAGQDKGRLNRYIYILFFSASILYSFEIFRWLPRAEICWQRILLFLSHIAPVSRKNFSSPSPLSNFTVLSVNSCIVSATRWVMTSVACFYITQ